MQFHQLRDRYTDFYWPQFRVELGPPGKRFDQLSKRDRFTLREHHGVVSDLSVDATLDGADRFSFSLVDTFDLEAGRFRESVWERFEPGTPVRLSLGYDGRLLPVLEGQIQSLAPDFPAGSSPTLDVSGYDRLHEMTTQTDPVDFERATMTEIVRAVVETYGFDERSDTLVVEDVDVPEFEHLKREKQNDFEFLSKRAKRYNFELFSRLETPPGKPDDPATNRLYFRSPRDDPDPPGSTLTLEYGESLQSFSVESNEEAVPGVVLRYRDRRRGVDIEEAVPRATDTDGYRELSTPVESAEEGRVVARAEYETLLQQRVTGSGDVVGLPDLRIGDPVRLDRVGRFSGAYYVTGVTHRVGGSGFTTSFTVRRPAPQVTGVIP